MQVTLKVDRTNLNIDIGVNAPVCLGMVLRGGVRWFRRLIRVTLLSISSLACQAMRLLKRPKLLVELPHEGVAPCNLGA